jgi:hypothetical protein
MVTANSDEYGLMLGIEAITALSRDVAAGYDPRLRVIGVASTNGESGRVELLVTLPNSTSGPSVVMLNVTRLGQGAFERDLGEKLRAALAAHPPNN